MTLLILKFTEHSKRIVEEGGFIDMQTLRFKDDAIQGLLLFKIKFSGYQNTYSSDQFKALIEDA